MSNLAVAGAAAYSLVCDEISEPPIPLYDNVDVIVGRGNNIPAEYRIVSREHTRIRLIPPHTLRLTQLGANSVTLTNALLSRQPFPLHRGRTVDVDLIGGPLRLDVAVGDKSIRTYRTRHNTQSSAVPPTGSEYVEDIEAEREWRLTEYSQSKRRRIETAEPTSPTAPPPLPPRPSPVQRSLPSQPVRSTPPPPPPPPPSSSSSTPRSPTTPTISPTMNAPSLAFCFPALCTGILSFPVSQSTAAMMSAVKLFLSATKSPYRLTVIEDSSNPSYQSITAALSADETLTRDGRFRVVIGDIITDSRTRYGADYIACVTDFRFKGADTIRQRVNKLMDDRLAEIATSSHRVGVLTRAYSIAVPPTTSLAKNGISNVIAVVGPNMNRAFADSHDDDVEKASTLLTQSYANMLQVFASTHAPHHVTFAVTNIATSRSSPPDSTNSTSAMLTTKAQPQPKVPHYRPPASQSAATGHWSTGLLQYLQTPRVSSLEPSIYEETNDLIAVYDKFPKSSKHLLIMHKRLSQINGVTDCRPPHIPLINAMRDFANRIADEIGISSAFLMGFHSEPSMKPLHMHLLSSDLHSDWLKVKRHYNSFTTEFLIRVDQVIAALNGPDGRVVLGKNDVSAALNTPLRCHRDGCGAVVRTMPQLKTHIAHCTHSLPHRP